MFEHSTSAILRGYMLEVFVGKGCSGADDYAGGGFETFSGHDDVGFTGFFMEELSYRRDHKVKKGLVGIKMVEFRKNMALFIDEGCEV